MKLTLKEIRILKNNLELGISILKEEKIEPKFKTKIKEEIDEIIKEHEELLCKLIILEINEIYKHI